MGSIVMNLAGQHAGLDNAATPLGFKAMKELQDPQSGARHCEQRSDPVPGDQHRGGDSDPDHDLRLSRPDGRRRSHRRVHSAARGVDLRRPCSVFWSPPSSSGCKLWDRVVLAYLGGHDRLRRGPGGVLRPPRPRCHAKSQLGVLELHHLHRHRCLPRRRAASQARAALRAFVDGAKEGFQVAIGSCPTWSRCWWRSVFSRQRRLDFLLDGVRWLVAPGGWRHPLGRRSAGRPDAHLSASGRAA